MHSLAQAGYNQVRRQTMGPRQVEQQLLTSIAAELEAADPATPEGYRAMAAALQRNNDLWSSLAADLMHEENNFPDEIKVGLLSLANYSLSRAIVILRGEEDRGTLVEINRTVAAGLKTQAQEEAA